MNFPWPSWMAASVLFLTVALWGAHRTRRLAGWLFLAWVGLGLGLLPLWHGLAHSTAAWLHQGQGPEALAQALMPSRRLYPLSHYLARIDALTVQALVWMERLNTLGTAALFLFFRRKGAFRHALPRWLRLWLWVAVPFLALYGGFEAAFRWGPHPVFYTGCPKLWGHRGAPDPPAILEDTLPSFRRALDLGAPGVEMDVAYDPAANRFFIHRPDNPAIPPTPLPVIFQALGRRGYYWVDLKTLRTLTPEQARQAAAAMRRLLSQYDLLDRVIVESDAPRNLREMVRAGVHTSYWIFNMDETQLPPRAWAYWWLVYRYKAWYIWGGFSAISMDARFYTPALALVLSGARIHLFTVDDPQRLRELAVQPQVRVILTNRNRYDIAPCR